MNYAGVRESDFTACGQVGKHTLMMREILPNQALGSIFWAGDGVTTRLSL